MKLVNDDKVLKKLLEKKELIEKTRLSVARIQGAIDAAENDLKSFGVSSEEGAIIYLQKLDEEMKLLHSELDEIINNLEAKCIMT